MGVALRPARWAASPAARAEAGSAAPLFQERLHFGAQVGRDISIKTACDSGLTKMHGGILPKRILNWKGSIAPAADKKRPARPAQLFRRKKAGAGKMNGEGRAGPARLYQLLYPKRLFASGMSGVPRPSGFGDAGIGGHRKAPLHLKGAFPHHLYCMEVFVSLRLVPERESQAHQTGHWHGINKDIPICPGNRAQDKREVSKVRSNIPLASRSAASAVCYKSSREPQHAQTNMRKQQCTFERASAHTKPYSRQEPNDQADKVKQVKTFRGIVPQSSHGPFTAHKQAYFSGAVLTSQTSLTHTMVMKQQNSSHINSHETIFMDANLLFIVIF